MLHYPPTVQPACKKTRTKPVKIQSTSKQGKQKQKKKVRQLKIQERKSVVESVDKAQLLSHVCDSVSKGLVSSLFPERMELWKYLQDTKEFEHFVYSAADKYIIFFDQHSKGKEKYANLYLTWLKYITSFTCRSKQSLVTLCTLSLLLGGYGSAIQPETQRTVIASILHGVQEGMQCQMAAKIEEVESEPSMSELPGDDTALYRISGWALKSAIDLTRKAFKQENAREEVQHQLHLLNSLKRPNASKGTLPSGAQYLDRGGLTFMQPSLLPWLHAVEDSMKMYLNQDGYKKYGKDIFSVS